MKKTLLLLVVALSLSSCSSIKIALKREEGVMMAIEAKMEYYEEKPWIPLSVDAYNPYRIIDQTGYNRLYRENKRKAKKELPFFRPRRR